jgi:hypothetical protein
LSTFEQTFNHVTDANGRYEFSEPTSGPINMNLSPPIGYERAQQASYVYRIPGPGEFDVRLRRVVMIQIMNAPATIRVDGMVHSWASFNTTCPTVLDTGETFDALTNSDGAMDADPRILRVDHSGVQAIATGNTSLRCMLWFQYSSPSLVQGVP